MFKAHANLLRRQPATALIDEKRGVFACPCRALNQPGQIRVKRLAAYRHAAPFGALAEHMRLTGLHINPATGVLAGLCVKAHQLANAQAAAIKKLGDAAVARFELRRHHRFAALIARQLHRFIDAQRFGQRLGRLGRPHILYRIAGNQSAPAQPGVKTAPARQNQRNAARAAPAAVHLCHPATDVRVVQLQQRQPSLARVGGEFFKVQRIQLDSALGQAFFNPNVLKVALNEQGRCSVGLSGFGRYRCACRLALR